MSIFFKEILIKDIVVKNNHRLEIDPKEIDGLAANIKAVGLLQPIGVSIIPGAKSKYAYEWGFRRMKAFEKLKIKKIMACVMPHKKDAAVLQQILLNTSENLQRANPTFQEYGRAIEQLHETHKMTLDAIAKHLGKPLKQITEYYRTWTALPKKHRSKVKFMLKRGRTGGGVGAHLANRILAIKRKHGLSAKNEDLLFKKVDRQEISKDRLQTVGSLLKDGMAFNEAMNCVGKYKVYNIAIVADHTQIDTFRRELGAPNDGIVLKRILYGEAPPLDKPNFIKF